MIMTGKRYLYTVFACLFVVALLSDGTSANEERDEKRIAKRSVSFDDWKRAGGYMNELESALGTMQRPRFGKRFLQDLGGDEYVLLNDKRGNGLMDLETALGSMQRPRFGRRR